MSGTKTDEDDRRIVTDGGQPTCYTNGCRRDGEHRLRLTFDFSESTHSLVHSYCQRHAEVQFDSTSDLVEVEEISDPSPISCRCGTAASPQQSASTTNAAARWRSSDERR